MPPMACAARLWQTWMSLKKGFIYEMDEEKEERTRRMRRRKRRREEGEGTKEG